MKRQSKFKKNEPKNESMPSEHITASSAASSNICPADYDNEVFDIMLNACFAKLTCWLSPTSLGLAMHDWLSHLALAPAKRVDLANEAKKNLEALFSYAYSQCESGIGVKPNPCVEPRLSDSRFNKEEGWDTFPFNFYSQNFLLAEKWWNDATKNIHGVSKHHEDIVNFTTRQFLDMLSPSNFPITNPQVIAATLTEGGMNFLRGFQNFIEDYSHLEHKLPPIGSEKFIVGKDVAVTPGKVIYKNRLIELIQYEPTTAQVYAEPILITPAWIMKYYILDLSPHNSLVKYLVDHGHTVFIISWKNPDNCDRDLTLNDYLDLGILSSLDVINKIVPNQKIHATGYCLGGTLLMIAAAAMAQTNDERLKSLTLFAAQVDFRNPGELSLFIDQSQISYLEDAMWEKGYLDGPQMAGAFSMLRSNDLIWSRLIADYLLGRRRPLNDLMAWDNDTTRLPYKMHSEYLRNLFLNNELVHGRYKVNKKPIALNDIQKPLFVVATIKDHVSPWRSVYKVQLYTNAELTFVLTSGGHNAGIVNEPGHKGRSYQIGLRVAGARHINADQWLERNPSKVGSWWPEWEKWLTERSGVKIAPPALGEAKNYPVICDAPGTYVLQK
ncbi:MAG: alpha/beta fold hydrolase [Gammaproteobacteria bacterium]|nr:alpha/beta fold hydrolase [Gammaproteobacteria bacterium]